MLELTTKIKTDKIFVGSVYHNHKGCEIKDNGKVVGLCIGDKLDIDDYNGDWDWYNQANVDSCVGAYDASFAKKFHNDGHFFTVPGGVAIVTIEYEKANFLNVYVDTEKGKPVYDSELELNLNYENMYENELLENEDYDDDPDFYLAPFIKPNRRR